MAVMTPSLSLALVMLAAQEPRPASVSRSADSARALVQAAIAMVNRDSSTVALGRWRAQLTREPTNRTALLSLATIATLTARREEADRAITKLVAGGKDDPFTAAALLVRGRAKVPRLELRSAQTDFRRVREVGRVTGDSASSSAALLGLAATTRRMLGPTQARAFIDTALAMAPDSSSLALIWCDDAFAGVRTLDPVRQALLGAAIAHERDDPRLEARCRFTAGRAYWYRRRMDSTYASLTSAVTLARSVRDHETAGRSLWMLGLGFRLLGQTERSLQNLRQAVQESEAAGDITGLAYEELNLGLIAQNLRDYGSAERYARASAARYDAGGDAEGRASVRFIEGTLALSRADRKTALSTFTAGLAWAKQSGDLAALVDMTTGLFRLSMAEGRWSDASVFIDSIAAAYRRAGTAGWENAVSQYRGALAAARGDGEGTVRLYKSWLDNLHNAQHNLLYEVRRQLALGYLRTGNAEAAELELTKANDELDRYRDSLTDADIKLHAAETAVAYGAPADAAERVIAAIVANGKLASAFNLVERQRARNALERVARVQVASAKGGPSIHRSPTPPTLDAFVAAIPDDRTAVLEYVVGSSGSPTSLIVITRKGARGYVLPRLDSLMPAMSAFETLIEGGAPALGPARALGTALVARATEGLPREVSRLLIVPDGPLHRLSFDALVLPSGQRVVERYAVGLLPSAAIAAELWRRARPSREASILAIGDPQFASEKSPGTDDSERLMRDGFADIGGLIRLPGSGDEARDVATFARRSELRLRERASESYIKRTPLDSFSVIHLATHALVDDASISRTALALAPGDNEDGFLGVAELQNTSLTADVVVLSACRTARGLIVGGEGVQGLAAPFLYAGARSVVATAWRIGDTRARRFVNQFYSGMQRGEPVVDALRTAKLDALHRGAPPRDWAVFSAMGDPLTQVPLR